MRRSYLYCVYLVSLSYLALLGQIYAADSHFKGESLFASAKYDKDDLCAVTITPPNIPRRDSEAWQFISQEADLALRGGTSHFQGDVQLILPYHIIDAQHGQITRDDSRQVHEVSLDKDIAWQHRSWRLFTDTLQYFPKKSRIEASKASFMLFPGWGIYPWGWADAVVSDSPYTLTMHNTRVTTCMPENMVWSIGGRTIDWDESSKRLLIQDSSLYWYNTKLFGLGTVSFVDGEQTSGWLMPKVRYFPGDGIQIGRPFRFAYSPRTYDLMPFFTTRGGLGFQFFYEQRPRGVEQLGVSKFIFRPYAEPKSRFVGFYGGEQTLKHDARLKWQFVQSSDGMFIQQVSPLLGVDFFRPNQDLVSFIAYDASLGRSSLLAMSAIQQRFVGDKWSYDLYSLPNFDVLPVLWFSQQPDHGWFFQAQADNLRLLSPGVYPYPSAIRFLGYGGYQGQQIHGITWQLGGWFKARHLSDSTLFDISENRSFLLPNADIMVPIWQGARQSLSLSYHYTAYTEQNNEPLFTTKYWFWRDRPLPYYLASMDRIFDRNIIKLHWQATNVLRRQGAIFSWVHFLSLQDRRVSITLDATEDPVFSNPLGVSSLSLLDQRSGMDASLQWVWPEQKVHALSIRLPYRRAQLYWEQGPGEVIWQDLEYSMPFERKLGVHLPINLSRRWRYTLDVAYRSKLDDVLYWQNIIHYQGCCWEADLSVSQNKLISVYTDNALQPSENLQYGLQVKLRGL